MKFLKWFAVFTLPFMIAIFVIRAANGYDGLPSMPTIISVFSRIEFHGFKEFKDTLADAGGYFTRFNVSDWSAAGDFFEKVWLILQYIGNFFVGIGYVIFAFLKLIAFTIYDIIQVFVALWNIITLPSETLLPI